VLLELTNGYKVALNCLTRITNLSIYFRKYANYSGEIVEKKNFNGCNVEYYITLIFIKIESNELINILLKNKVSGPPN